MRERGQLAVEARRIAAAHGVSLRQAYRYVKTGRQPSDCVRVGTDGRRYHVHEGEGRFDPVDVRRIRYTVAGVAKRAHEHGITDHDVAELELAIQCAGDLAATWRSSLTTGGEIPTT